MAVALTQPAILNEFVLVLSNAASTDFTEEFARCSVMATKKPHEMNWLFTFLRNDHAVTKMVTLIDLIGPMSRFSTKYIRPVVTELLS